MTVAERIEVAVDRPPLAALSARDRAELEALLATCRSFEDLPGRWQAAVLEAEGAAAPAGGCCGGCKH